MSDTSIQENAARRQCGGSLHAGVAGKSCAGNARVVFATRPAHSTNSWGRVTKPHLRLATPSTPTSLQWPGRVVDNGGFRTGGCCLGRWLTCAARLTPSPSPPTLPSPARTSPSMSRLMPTRSSRYVVLRFIPFSSLLLGVCRCLLFSRRPQGPPGLRNAGTVSKSNTGDPCPAVVTIIDIVGNVQARVSGRSVTRTRISTAMPQCRTWKLELEAGARWDRADNTCRKVPTPT